MIYYISLNGLSTMDEKSVGYSIKKAKHLKRKIIGIYLNKIILYKKKLKYFKSKKFLVLINFFFFYFYS